MKPIIRKYKEPVIEVPVNNGTQVEQIVGNFQQSSTVPVNPPKTFKESIVIVGSNLYFFDYKASTWRNANPPNPQTVYSGHMSSGGVFTLPTGWTGSVGSAGAITITHNLNTTFNVLGASYDSNNFHYYLASLGTNYFEFYTFTLSSNVYTQATVGFTFILNTY